MPLRIFRENTKNRIKMGTVDRMETAKAESRIIPFKRGCHPIFRKCLQNNP